MERDEILPFHSHNYNLDDLENVQGFNSIGKRNELYCFKLTNNGMYILDMVLLMLKIMIIRELIMKLI